MIIAQNEYQPHVPNQKKKREEEMPGAKEQGASVDRLSPEGSYLIQIALPSPIQPPGTSPLGSEFNQVHEQQASSALKVQTPALKPGSLRIKLIPQQRSLWSKKPHRKPRQEVKQWILLQSNLSGTFRAEEGKV